MSSKKLKNAPHLGEQNDHPYGEIIALVGSQAWQAWGVGKDKGKGEEWLLLKQAIGAENGYKPLILGESQLEEIQNLRLANDNHGIFRVCLFGELSYPQEQAIILNLALNSQIKTLLLCDRLGQKTHDISHQLKEMREDEQAQVIAQEIASIAQGEDDPKTSPYVDFREINGLQGLYYVKPKIDNQTGEILREDQMWICSPLELVGNGKNEQGDYFYIFQWQNPDEKQPRIEAVSCGDFGTEAGWKILKNQGLKMTSRGIASNLIEHFHALSPNVEKWTVTHCTGWHNGAYLLPNGDIIGEPNNPIIFKNRSAAENGYKASGSLADWQREIAQYVYKNPSMMLGVATALAGPLLRLLKADSFGVHLFNSSSKGKTTILNIANSIYGNPTAIDLSWNTTPTALNNEASSRNDGFITLDELGQAKKIYDVENIAYSLFNEKGRSRGNKEGGNDNLNRWKITALSTGEKDVETFLNSKGVNINAGQLVRLLNIPLTEASHFYDFDSPKAHADHLNHAAKTYYGTLGREWIKLLAENKEKATALYTQTAERWQKRLLDTSSQVQRVGSRFAILETALLLAKDLLQWEAEECKEAVIKSFNDWLNDYGKTDREELNIIEFLIGWLEQYGESCFAEVPEPPIKRIIQKLYGYRILEVVGGEKEHFYFFTGAFKNLLKENGIPRNIAFDVLEKSGMIKKGKEQEERPYQHKVKTALERHINSNGKRFYIVYPHKIDEEENQAEEN